MKKKIIVIVALVLLASLFLILIFLKNKKDSGLLDYSKNYQQEKISNEDEDLEYLNDEEIIYCPQDVFECPDGSFVGRISPECNFAKCPNKVFEKLDN